MSEKSTAPTDAIDILGADDLVRDQDALARLRSRPPAIPWAVQLAVAIAAVVASSLMLAFAFIVSMDWLLESPPAQLLVGGALCACAALVNRRAGDDDDRSAAQLFRADLMLAAGLIGFALLSLATGTLLDDLIDGRKIAALLGPAAVAAILVVLNPEPVHRFLMTVAAALLAAYGLAAVGLVVDAGEWLLAAVTVIWLTQPRWGPGRNGSLLLTVGAALTVTLLLLLVMPSVFAGTLGWHWLPGRHYSEEPTGLALLWLQRGLQIVTAVAIVATGFTLWSRERAMTEAVRATASGSGTRTAAQAGPLPGPLPGRLPGWLVAVLAAAVLWCLVRSPLVAPFLLIWVLTLASGHRRLAILTLAALVVGRLLDYWALEVPLMTKGLDLLELAAAAAIVSAALVHAQRRGRPGVAT